MFTWDRPQSHSSPSSLKPLPQIEDPCNCSGRFWRQKSSPWWKESPSCSIEHDDHNPGFFPLKTRKAKTEERSLIEMIFNEQPVKITGTERPTPKRHTRCWSPWCTRCHCKRRCDRHVSRGKKRIANKSAIMWKFYFDVNMFHHSQRNMFYTRLTPPEYW